MIIKKDWDLSLKILFFCISNFDLFKSLHDVHGQCWCDSDNQHLNDLNDICNIVDHYSPYIIMSLVDRWFVKFGIFESPIITCDITTLNVTISGRYDNHKTYLFDISSNGLLI
jgi:hypothetical protein